jgi:hypothetical protein
MTRVVSVGRSQGHFSIWALSSICLLAVGLIGCPGTLDDPGAFPGTAGSSGSSAGSNGQAGSGSGGSGTAGSGSAGGGGSLPGCDTTAIFKKSAANSCALAFACHDKDGSAAGFKMAPAGFEANLVGKMPDPNNAGSYCGKDPAFKNMAYLIKGPAPVDGLLLRKLKGAVCVDNTMTPPGMGVRMPSNLPALSDQEMACVQAWADKLAQP